MIIRLYLDNFYVHQNKTFHFDEGLTGIIGPNESGKSLIQEAIRYALFGSAALRATAPKNLHVELDFIVAGVTYTVIRKGRNADLNGIASGTKPVNEAIIKILGYDLQVFDVANSCNQGSVEALSEMRPTERKAMVDRTVGLDVLDVAMKYCGDRGNTLKSQAMGLKASLTAPEPVELPEGYAPSQELSPAVQQLELDVRELNQIRGFLSRPVLAPEGGPFRSIETLRALMASAKEYLAEVNQLAGYLSRAPEPPIMPEPCTITEDLEAYQDNRTAILSVIKSNRIKRESLDLEVYLPEELDAREAQLDQYDLWLERSRLLAQGHLCCPACNHTWPVAGNIPEAAETEKPPMSRAELAKHRARTGNQALFDALIDPELPVDRAADLQAQRAAQAALQAYTRAQTAYVAYHASFVGKQARWEALQGSDALVTALGIEQRGATAMAAYEAYKAEATPKRLRLIELETCEADLGHLRTRLAEAIQYEFALKAFLRLQEVYERNLTVNTELVNKSEVYFKARLDMLELKTKVKSHLLPSLNKVASHLLREMTGGERYLVEVDDEFDIKIDGAAINTLSGSGKAVANLSIRLALGRILTNRVFSIFMADEVDGSMDADRSDYVALSLRRLTGVVKQVILITHKRPDVDQTIELKK